MKIVTTIIAIVAFAAATVVAQTPANSGKPWTAEQETSLSEAVAAGQSIEQIAQTLERTPKAVTMHMVKLGLTPPATSAPVAAAAPAATPTPVTATPPLTVPATVPTLSTVKVAAKKKILVGALSLNRVDRDLIDKLKAADYEIVFAGPKSIKKVDVSLDWHDKSQPPSSRKSEEGAIPADYETGTFPAEAIREYSAFIFPNADDGKELGLPMDKILKSGKLVVLGEVPNIDAGEKLLLGEPLTGNYTPRTYQTSSASKRLGYVIYASSWKVKKYPTGIGNIEFVEKRLLPQILSNL